MNKQLRSLRGKRSPEFVKNSNKFILGCRSYEKKMETDAAMSNYLKVAIQEIGCFWEKLYTEGNC